MYLMITDRCNMSCEHCCFNCTQKGTDMSKEVFAKALEFCDWDYVTIGGGEPTLHPNFWEIFMTVLGQAEGLDITTNGSNKTIALTLAKLANKKIISAALSIDEWHDPIDDEVYEAFRPKGKRDGYCSIKDTGTDYNGRSRLPIAAGRAESFGRKDECPCAGMIIKPNGDIFHCGCADAPKLGTVFTEIGEYTGECYKEMEESHGTNVQ